MANTITTDDVRSYYNSLPDFGLRHQFQGVRFDSGPNSGKTVFFDGTVELPLHFIKTPQKLSRVIKVTSPSKDVPLEKLGDKSNLRISNVDYYKESLKKLMAEHGY